MFYTDSRGTGGTSSGGNSASDNEQQNVYSTMEPDEHQLNHGDKIGNAQNNQHHLVDHNAHLYHLHHQGEKTIAKPNAIFPMLIDWPIPWAIALKGFF